MRVSDLQPRHMYEESPEEQDDNYEPPPSHTLLAAANSASFSGEEYLGGYSSSLVVGSEPPPSSPFHAAASPSLSSCPSSPDNRHSLPHRPPKKPVFPTRNTSRPQRARAPDLESDEVT